MDTTLPDDEIRPKLLLLDPYPRNNSYHMTVSERWSIWFPNLSLPAIAAYTPTTWDVEILVNVENLQQATPKAIYTLFDGEITWAIIPHMELWYRNFKEAFQSIVSEIALENLDLFDEDIQYA
ncbi:MAG: siderophore-interacting protein [Nitrospirota bacterium]|nr:siderophore-interacting protein [Nitrospirota bacterium]MDH5699785.1 siderophore-interacting protein [Nitrospirota bacterium]